MYVLRTGSSAMYPGNLLLKLNSMPRNRHQAIPNPAQKSDSHRSPLPARVSSRLLRGYTSCKDGMYCSMLRSPTSRTRTAPRVTAARRDGSRLGFGEAGYPFSYALHHRFLCVTSSFFFLAVHGRGGLGFAGLGFCVRVSISSFHFRSNARARQVSYLHADCTSGPTWGHKHTHVLRSAFPRHGIHTVLQIVG